MNSFQRSSHAACVKTGLIALFSFFFVASLPAAAPGFAQSGSAPKAAAPGMLHIAFEPAPGTRLTKSFTLSQGLVMQDITLGNKGANELSQQQLELSTEQVVRVEDEYTRSAAGRPAELRRVFQAVTLQADIEFADGSGSTGKSRLEAASPLQPSQSVFFTWVPEEKNYGAYYDAAESAEEYLSLLAEDLDLRALLPDHDVHAGETWEIDPHKLVDVVAPGGRIPLRFTKGGDSFFIRSLMTGVGAATAELFGGEANGKVVARCDGARTEKDAELATIALDVDIDLDRDQKNLAQRSMTRAELQDGYYVGEASIKWKLTGRGELVWNLGAGRFESFTLSCQQQVTGDLQLKNLHGGASQQILKMSGGFHLAAATGEKAAAAAVKASVPSTEPVSGGK